MEISDGMDITAYAMMNSQIQIQQGVNTQVLKKTMDLQEAQGSQLVQMMEQSVNPGLGQNIDVRI
ncbi:MAG TPA: putative motility protein [Lachnospiraceae bacterium]|nr:putative motility protein [Lachnospiraceae bacterium]